MEASGWVVGGAVLVVFTLTALWLRRRPHYLFPLALARGAAAGEGWRGLSSSGRGVLRVLEAASSDGIACLIATHHRALVHYADRVLRISDGRLDEVQAGDVVAAGDEL